MAIVVTDIRSMQNLKTMERTEGYKNKNKNKNEVELIVSISAKVRERPFVRFANGKNIEFKVTIVFIS